MATHFDPYPDDDEAEQAPCGTWLGETSKGTSNWAHVDCKVCRKLKAKNSDAHEASEAAIVEQMGDMAAYMRAGIPAAEYEGRMRPPSEPQVIQDNPGAPGLSGADSLSRLPTVTDTMEKTAAHVPAIVAGFAGIGTRVRASNKTPQGATHNATRSSYAGRF